MNRTLEDIERDLELVKKELNPIRNKYEKICEKINNLENEKLKYKLNNRLYSPISDLNKYIDKDILYIELVEENKNGTLKVISLTNSGGVLYIDENGHLNYSSDDDYLIQFDNNIKMYCEWYYLKKINTQFYWIFRY